LDEGRRDRENVLRAITIFEEIEAEERAKVSELFDDRGAVTDHFRWITDGLYEGVVFNRETEAVEVRRKDGIQLRAEKLSGGAYDQLYLSVRLALAERLLKDRKGFFMMDDPFIKSDRDRLHRQLEVLKRISESGWQIIYFSAKEEIRDALGEGIEKGTIHHLPIESLWS
jgi:uncharacterized protein YhaN